MRQIAVALIHNSWPLWASYSFLLNSDIIMYPMDYFCLIYYLPLCLSSELLLFCFVLFCFLMAILFCSTLIFYLNLFCSMAGQCSSKWNVKLGDKIAWESQCVSKRWFYFDKDLATFLKFQIGINKVPFSMVGP